MLEIPALGGGSGARMHRWRAKQALKSFPSLVFLSFLFFLHFLLTFLFLTFFENFLSIDLAIMILVSA